MGKQSSATQKGNYFTTNSNEYFDKVIKPWRYQFTKTLTDTSSNDINNIGKITFWRNSAIYDNVAKKNWTPNMSFEIYFNKDSTFCENLSDKTKFLSTCDSVNKGGDIFLIGNFILLNTSSCVNCSSLSKIDYCRNIIKIILESVPNKETDNWNTILNGFIIDKGKFKNLE